MDIQSFFSTVTFGFVDPVLAFNLSSLILLIVVYKILWGKLYERALKTPSFIDEIILEALNVPFYLIVALLFSKIILLSLPKSIIADIKEFESHLGLIYSAFPAFIILVLVNGFFSKVQSTIRSLEKDDDVPNSMAWISACKLGRLVSAIVFILVVLTIFDLPVAQIAAPTAVGALALSFASKDVLSNMFGGLVIMCDKPYKVGDYVKIGSLDEGTITYIGWRMTQLTLANGKILHVPNGSITTSAVTNSTQKAYWVIRNEIILRKEDIPMVEKIVKDIEDYLDQYEHRRKGSVYFACLSACDQSKVAITMQMTLRSSLTPKQWHQACQAVLLRVHDIVTGYGAEISTNKSS